jgi:hypothetical protein
MMELAVFEVMGPKSPSAMISWRGAVIVRGVRGVGIYPAISYQLSAIRGVRRAAALLVEHL